MVCVLSLILITFGCDNSFQPIKENNKAFFSFYGYLDASADTQWVRVAPVRNQLSTPPVKPDMRVTLEEVESGTMVAMNDSLFQLGNGYNYLNSWTTMDIKPEHTYRMVAERPDGATSSVTITTPPDFPTPRLSYIHTLSFPPGCTALLSINDITHLADVQSVWRYQVKSEANSLEQVYRFPYRGEVYGTVEHRSVELSAIAEKGNFEVPGNARLRKRYIFVASGGPEWIDGLDSLDTVTYTLPTTLSNVKNGLGYVVGIVSKTIPYEMCH